jgi:hypothetical protein
MPNNSICSSTTGRNYKPSAPGRAVKVVVVVVVDDIEKPAVGVLLLLVEVPVAPTVAVVSERVVVGTALPPVETLEGMGLSDGLARVEGLPLPAVLRAGPRELQPM